ncbi:MAG: DegV family protein [Chloroflexota bacterium]|nr:DegV family protein [Chloroflexota bacterium]
MNKVTVATGSPAAIPPELAEEYGIITVPFHTIVDGKDYLDTEMDMAWLYDWLQEKGKLATTSFPPPKEFLQAYSQMARNSEAIVYISLTSAFSRAYTSAVEASESARKELPGIRIEVINSCTVEAGETAIVIEAARAAREGKPFDQIVRLARERVSSVSNLQTFDTLFYRSKQGRIFEAKSWAEAESAASFKAILEVDASTGGITKPVARAGTKRHALEKMTSMAEERVGNGKLHAAIVHANVPEQAELLKEMLLSQCRCEELYVSEACAATAAQTGGGLISLGFYGSE